MPSSMRVVQRDAGYWEILNSDGVLADLQRRGKAMLSQLDREKGYTMTSEKGHNRAHVRVFARGIHARRENRKRHTLLKSLGAAKG